jgi:2'-5' RNA ligase
MSEVARLFVAVRPGVDAVAHLDDALASHRTDWPGIRWTAPAMWHVTCAFFGDVDLERIGDLERRLARAVARHRRTTLRIAGAGAFARPAKATVVFAPVEVVPAAPVGRSELAALATSCAAAGRRLGLSMDARAFRPHLTLGRVKGRSPMDVRPLVSRLHDYVGPAWPASALLLIRSHLGPDPRYETLADWALRGDTP